MKKDHDYTVFLFFIVLWLIIGGMAQCQSADELNDIKHEISDIRHDLNMMKYYK